MQNNCSAITPAQAVTTDEYTLSPELATSLLVPVRTDISRKALHQRLARFNRSHGTNYQLPPR